MEIIKSLNNSKIKEIRKLRQKKYRDSNRLFIVEGEHLFEEALKSNLVKTIITTDYQYQNQQDEVVYVDDKVMADLSNYQSFSKYLAVCRFVDNEIDYQKKMVVLDDIQDPGNLGTIIRTSLAFNIKNIVLGKGCADLYNPKTIQASQGAVFELNFTRVELLAYCQKLKKLDYYLIGTSLNNAKSLTKTEKADRDKAAFFFGNEGQGMKEELLNLMDQNYYIEIKNIESLNVVSATSILLYQLL